MGLLVARHVSEARSQGVKEHSPGDRGSWASLGHDGFRKLSHGCLPRSEEEKQRNDHPLSAPFLFLLEVGSGLWRFLSWPSIGAFMGSPDQVTVPDLVRYTTIWTPGCEISVWFYHGVLQPLDSSTVNWFRATLTCLIHTNKESQFILLLICSTVMPGSCSHPKQKPSLPLAPHKNPGHSKSRGCFDFFFWYSGRCCGQCCNARKHLLSMNMCCRLPCS